MIDSVRLEEKVHVLVASPRYDHKPFNLAYQIPGPEDSLR